MCEEKYTRNLGDPVSSTERKDQTEQRMGESLKRPAGGNVGTRHKARTLTEPMVGNLSGTEGA